MAVIAAVVVLLHVAILWALQSGLLEKVPTVHRITSADYPLPAPRPTNSRLDCSRFRRDFGLGLPDWRIGLADCLADARF